MTNVRVDLVATTARRDGTSPTAVFDRAIRMATLGETLGYDGIWLLEHHFTPYGLCPDTITMSGYVLGATSTLRVGTAVCVAPFHNPIRLAENVALLDQLSHGRFDVGLGRGGFGADFAAFGVDPARSTDLLFETTERLVEILSVGGVVLPERGPDPHPVQPPTYTQGLPPLYVACESATTAEWAAEGGLGLLLHQPGKGVAGLLGKLELYDAVAATTPHPGHVVFCIGHVADSMEAAADHVLPHLLWWANAGLAAAFTFAELRQLPNYEAHFRQWQQAVLDGLTSEAASVEMDVVRRRVNGSPVGTVDHCVRTLQELIDACGIAHIAVGFEASNDDGLIEEAMTRLAVEVRPRLRAPADRPAAALLEA